jgi:FPC/CPF motif-containing protein YcgG
MTSDTTLVNPFDSPLALAQSNSCLFDGRRLSRDGDEPDPSPRTAFVHDGFRALVLNEHFSCVAAKSAVRHGNYRFGLYDELASAASCAGLARDLFAFVHADAAADPDFRTFVASFDGPLPPDEATFERLLWSTLQQLHDLDVVHHEWDGQSSADAADADFSFSFAGTAFFVVGLHAASSRTTRRFAWPTLVFNPHRQFDRLRETGQYPRFQQVIRTAERALQGDINPMLADFGSRSEASQYSGRQVSSEWQCPFHAKSGTGRASAAREERRDEPPTD